MTHCFLFRIEYDTAPTESYELNLDYSEKNKFVNPLFFKGNTVLEGIYLVYTFFKKNYWLLYLQ